MVGLSRPSWARGLKRLKGKGIDGVALSRPSWARGLKPSLKTHMLHLEAVAPLVGAWIETT